MRLIALFAACAAAAGSAVAAEIDRATALEQILALARVEAPATRHPAGTPDGDLTPIFFDALPWKGKPTRVFAWLGVPAATEPNARLPGIVLVHGGGGTAYKEWVQRWSARGFAAISIAVEGQTDERVADAPRGALWKRHEWAGPARQGIYADTGEPLADQWMFHAVADTILARRLLASLPRVNANQIGVMGISWGGVIVSTVIGIDPRFAFAIPTYGCGHLADSANQYGRALGESASYRELWDPMVRIDRARLPVLWLSWPGDQHFPLDCQAATYRAAPGARMVALLPKMGHSHPAGWNPPESYAFAESVVREGQPWLRRPDVRLRGDQVQAIFHSTKPLDRAVLISTTDHGFTGQRSWRETAAKLEAVDGKFVVTATLPPDVTAWFVNIHGSGLTASSDFQVAAR